MKTKGVEGVDGEVVLPGQGGTQKITVVGTGVQATAVTGIVNGGVQYISLTNRGNSYIYAPRVAISSAPSGATNITGIATAYLLGGIAVCSGAIDDTKKKVVQEVNLVNPGIGYTCNPEVAFFANGDSGVGAAATAKMENGIIGIVTVTAGGSGYTTTPTITVTAQNGISTTGAGFKTVIPFVISTATSTQLVGISSCIKTIFADSTISLTAIMSSWTKAPLAPGLTIIELLPSASTPIIAVPVGTSGSEIRNSQSTFALSRLDRNISPS